MLDMLYTENKEENFHRLLIRNYGNQKQWHIFKEQKIKTVTYNVVIGEYLSKLKLKIFFRQSSEKLLPANHY